MTPYGPEHVTVLVLIALVALIALRRIRRSARTPQAVDRIENRLRVLGWVLLANSILWTLWGVMPWAWNIEESLPLHFSDALRFIGPLALITRARWAVVVSYFWGLTLNMQSVLTPDVNYFVWPPLEFCEYWLAHGTGVLIPVLLVWGLGLHPTWRGFALAYAATVGWALIAQLGNLLTGGNYAYLHHAPAGPSLLDVMGPWPVYILVEALVSAGVWALITLPWVLVDRRSGALPAGPGGLVRRRPLRSEPDTAHSPVRDTLDTVQG
ncbi:TIGR02206 family membrane protein [Brachybacterium endophyticum]|uniref:TIGR02206 family membrane protein n=2 Tax=Brachybacterium endophyticum TaxID=2182385 RepID=A0A2U2RH03_9MICO|nr:TIGR02206 family membrane protein [Brachybacterium endophyticum]